MLPETQLDSYPNDKFQHGEQTTLAIPTFKQTTRTGTQTPQCNSLRSHSLASNV